MREVIIGPERINPKYDRVCREDEEMRKWWEASGDGFRRLVRAQEDFEASGMLGRMLKRILENLKNLKHVEIQAMENKGSEWDGWPPSWTPSWGARSVVLGAGSFPHLPFRPHAIFIAEGGHNVRKQLETVLPALHEIGERSDWTLGLKFHRLSCVAEGRAFDLSRQDWKMHEHRVRRVDVSEMRAEVRPGDEADYEWVERLLGGCVGIESLEVSCERRFQHFFVHDNWVGLRVLQLNLCTVKDSLLRHLLVRHAHTLESIIFDSVRLSNMGFVTKRRIPSWLAKFDLMRGMLKLKRVELFRPVQEIKEEDLPDTAKDILTQMLDGGSLRLFAEGNDIAKKLCPEVCGQFKESMVDRPGYVDVVFWFQS